MRRVIVKIDKNGNATVAPEGFSGTQCKDVTKALEKALGTTVQDVDTQELYTHGETSQAAYQR